MIPQLKTFFLPLVLPALFQTRLMRLQQNKVFQGGFLIDILKGTTKSPL
jgi:hypothetical protein